MIHQFETPLAATALSGLSTVWEFLSRGGIFMIPLLMTSIAGLMAIIFKLISFRAGRIAPESLSRAIHNYRPPATGSQDRELFAEISRGESTLARISAVAVQHRGKQRSEITHAVESAAREEILHLHSGLAVLDTVITVAPLLGLLGTASGLVTIFQGLGDNADNLAIAKGIAEALTTTIFGLAIAVPCVIAHGYFVRRVEWFTARLESLLSQLTTACEKSPTSL